MNSLHQCHGLSGLLAQSLHHILNLSLLEFQLLIILAHILKFLVLLILHSHIRMHHRLKHLPRRGLHLKAFNLGQGINTILPLNHLINLHHKVLFKLLIVIRPQKLFDSPQLLLLKPILIDLRSFARWPLRASARERHPLPDQVALAVGTSGITFTFLGGSVVGAAFGSLDGGMLRLNVDICSIRQ